LGSEILNVTTDATAPPEFDRAYPWVVRSLRQSQLLEAWLSQVRAAGGVMPSLKDFAALQAYREQGELTVYDVVNCSGSTRYRVAREGVAFKALFGTSSEGRFLDEAMSKQAWEIGRVSLDECVRQALPIYTVFSLEANDGQSVMCERLQLPFGVGSSEVTTMATSLKTTSLALDGSRAPTRRLGHKLDYSFRAVIGLE
jgi:hypothetical protein